MQALLQLPFDQLTATHSTIWFYVKLWALPTWQRPPSPTKLSRATKASKLVRSIFGLRTSQQTYANIRTPKGTSRHGKATRTNLGVQPARWVLHHELHWHWQALGPVGPVGPVPVGPIAPSDSWWEPKRCGGSIPFYTILYLGSSMWHVTL